MSKQTQEAPQWVGFWRYKDHPSNDLMDRWVQLPGVYPARADEVYDDLDQIAVAFAKRILPVLHRDERLDSKVEVRIFPKESEHRTRVEAFTTMKPVD